MYSDLIFRNDKLISVTDFFDALKQYKTDFDLSDEEAETWIYEDRESDFEPPVEYYNVTTQLDKWYELYSQLHDDENLTIYPTFTKAEHEDPFNDVVFEGYVMFVNGLNGCTRVSKQSLQHVMDFITFVEDHIGGRACIESTSNHSDVYYYVIRIVVWKDSSEANIESNNKPLYWTK